MSDFTCKACGWHGFPAFELVGLKMLARCMNDSCGQIDSNVSPADMNTRIARIEGKDVVISTGRDPSASPAAPRSPEALVSPRDIALPKVAAEATMNAPPASKEAPVDALKAIKKRRRWLRGEIKRLEALRIEDEELAAAEHAVQAHRRADNVRPIRKGAS